MQPGPDDIQIYYVFKAIAVPVLKTIPCVAVASIGAMVRMAVRPVKSMKSVGFLGYAAGGVGVGLAAYFLSWIRPLGDTVYISTLVAGFFHPEVFGMKLTALIRMAQKGKMDE